MLFRSRGATKLPVVRLYRQRVANGDHRFLRRRRGPRRETALLKLELKVTGRAGARKAWCGLVEIEVEAEAFVGGDVHGITDERPPSTMSPSRERGSGRDEGLGMRVAGSTEPSSQLSMERDQELWGSRIAVFTL